jgi:hypothetical protein
VSSLVSEVTRGVVITWNESFLDANHVPVTPATATLYVSYRTAHGVSTDTVAMSQNEDGTYSASWDSSQALPGHVNWSIKSAGPASATDGCFLLTANAANLATT